MKSEIIAIIAEFLDVAPKQLDEYKTLEDINIDSIDFLEIMFEIEEKFDAPIIDEMQRRKEQIHNLGDFLGLTEELILKHKESESIKANE
jgi:acyl carrier protein